MKTLSDERPKCINNLIYLQFERLTELIGIYTCNNHKWCQYRPRHKKHSTSNAKYIPILGLLNT